MTEVALPDRVGAIWTSHGRPSVGAASAEVAPATTHPDAADTYRQLAPAVLGYLRARDAGDPEDLLGEVFFQVARDLPRFEGDEVALRAWVFRIARNRLIDDRRRRAARPRTVTARLPDRGVEASSEQIDPELVAALGTLDGRSA